MLNILVAASYRHVPSLDQILQPAAVTRLRNQLLEAEYYRLGVEVRPRQILPLPTVMSYLCLALQTGIAISQLPLVMGKYPEQDKFASWE